MTNTLNTIRTATANRAVPKRKRTGKHVDGAETMRANTVMSAPAVPTGVTKGPHGGV